MRAKAEEELLATHHQKDELAQRVAELSEQVPVCWQGFWLGQHEGC